MAKYLFILGGILLGGIHSYPLFAQSNEGKEFWFGFMEHRDVGEATMVAMITSKENTAGEISVPGLDWDRSFEVIANQVTLVTLPRSVEHMGSEFVQGKGIHISMEAPSSVYIHQYFGMRSEATVILPVESLGREYFIMAYEGINLGGTEYPSEFLVVASEDSTVLQIELSTESKGRNLNRSPFEVFLNKGQSYQVQAARADADLTGTYLSANKNFALLAGTAWTQVPSFCQFRDNLLEQMFPISTWGRSFITVPFIHNPYDITSLFYQQLKATGFIYGSNLSVIEEGLSNLDLSEEERCKTNMIIALYYFYKLEQCELTFSESVIKFYQAIDGHKQSILSGILGGERR